MVEEAKIKNKTCVIVKVNFGKVYDLVRWDYLNYMMERLNFCNKWIMWMKECLESSTISVLVNGSPTKKFIPTKRLKQGTISSIYVFNSTKRLIGNCKTRKPKIYDKK